MTSCIGITVRTMLLLAGCGVLAIMTTGAGAQHTQVEVRRDATVMLQPYTRRTIGGGHAALDRLKWFGGHWGPSGGEDWRPQDFEQFGPAGYRAHPGRGFVVSGAMSQCKEDPARPGFVDRQSLVSHCANYPASTGMWPVEAVDMIHSSKTGQLYPNSCKGPTGYVQSFGCFMGIHLVAGYSFSHAQTVRLRFLPRNGRHCLAGRQQRQRYPAQQCREQSISNEK